MWQYYLYFNYYFIFFTLTQIISRDSSYHPLKRQNFYWTDSSRADMKNTRFILQSNDLLNQCLIHSLPSGVRLTKQSSHHSWSFCIKVTFKRLFCWYLRAEEAESHSLFSPFICSGCSTALWRRSQYQVQKESSCRQL